MPGRLAGWAAAAWLAGGVCAPALGESPLRLGPSEIEARLDLGAGLDGPGAERAELTLSPVWDGRLESGLKYRVSARLRADAADDLTPGRPNLAGYAPASRPAALGDAGELELRDAYVDFDAGPLDLRLGKQQVVWGKLYGFKLLDAVNPQSFREFILDDFEESRIGLWTVNAKAPLPDVGLGAWTAQAVWAPDPTVHRIPEDGATFELVAPRFRFGAAADEPQPPVRLDRPDDAINDAVYGARLAGFVGGFDVAFNLLSGMDPQPLGRVEINSSGPEVVRFHKRRTLAGASAAASLGPVAGRVELAYTFDRALVTRAPDGSLGYERSDQLGVALGIDASGPFDTMIGAQVLQDTLLDRPVDAVRPRQDVLTSAYVRKGFLDETLTARLQILSSDGVDDHVVTPSLAYDVSDQVKLIAKADIFDGDPDGIFGQFAGRDRFTLSLRRVF